MAIIQPIDPETENRESGDDPAATPLPVTLPSEYGAYSQVFSIEGAQALAPINDYAHAIEIEGDKVPPWGPIYPLAEPELEVLRQYLHDALARGWIRPSRSPTGAPILFVPKKGG